MSCPNDLGYARLGMVVGKRQLKFASARNRVRRIIRETFRLYSPTLPGLDVVVRVRVPLAEGTEAAQLATLLAKLK
jgi:ribonuclease P protein component